MPHSKTSKKRTHKRRRHRGGFFEDVSRFFSSLLPGSLLGGTPGAPGAGAPGAGAPGASSSAQVLGPLNTTIQGGKTGKKGKNSRRKH